MSLLRKLRRWCPQPRKTVPVNFVKISPLVVTVAVLAEILILLIAPITYYALLAPKPSYGFNQKFPLTIARFKLLGQTSQRFKKFRTRVTVMAAFSTTAIQAAVLSTVPLSMLFILVHSLSMALHQLCPRQDMISFWMKAILHGARV